jgi:hypothetical protein
LWRPPRQVPSKARIDARLQAASHALDHLGREVPDAEKNIARYRALAAPQSVDRFDIYEIFRKITEGISDLGYVGDPLP